MTFNIAIIGATGAVGNKLLTTIFERKFPVNKIYLVASRKSIGKIIKYENKKFLVESIEDFNFEKVDIAFFSAGASVSSKYALIAEEKNCYVIDNTSFFRMHEEIQLIIPEVNESHLDKTKRKIISNPNCSTIQMLVALHPIHKINKIKKIVVATYQSVSGAGQKAINELTHQSKLFLNNDPLVVENFPKPIAFNVIPQIDIFMDNKYTKEEMKMVNETNKILDKSINVNATCVRVPSIVGHAESIYIELEKDMKIENLEEALKNGKGIKYSNSDYHTPHDSEGKDKVYVSRLRKDINNNNIFNLWVVADNLLKGAALNSVQIAETLINKRMVIPSE